MQLFTAIRAEIEAFSDPADPAAMKSRELAGLMVAHTPEPLSRKQFTPGHITCTGLVLGPSLSSVLLVHHGRLGRWLLPGGHVEPQDGSLAGAARREVLEETGADLHGATAPMLIGVDVHGIPPKKDEPFHLHHDLVFGFIALTDAAVCSAESREVAWCSEADFDHYRLPPNIRLAYERFRRRIIR